MKRVLIIVSALFVLVIAALLIGPGFVDWSQYKAQAQGQIRNMTGLEAEFGGDISLALLPAPHVLIEDVKVRAPEGSGQEHLVMLDRLDVNIALAPLLSGDIVVKSVELVKPDIALEILGNGEPNWMTPEIEALLSKDKGAGGQQGGDLTKAVSLESVSITGGRFQYKASKAGKVLSVSDINLDIAAKSLSGPFDVEGSISTSGQQISFDAKAGEIKPGEESISLKTNAKIEPAGLEVSYAGIVGIAGALDLQGETAVNIASLDKTLSSYGVKNITLDQDKVALKGLLTGSPEKLEYKNLTVSAAGNELKGDLAVALKPLDIKASLQASEIFNVDALLGNSAKKENNGLDGLLMIVPETLSLPVPFEASVELSLPGLVYKNNAYSDVGIGFAKKDRSFKVAFSAQNIPGKGRLEALADLSFAAKSLSEKTGAESYSDGVLTLGVTGKTQNMPYTAQALSGLDDLPVISGSKTGHFDVNAVISPAKFELKESVVKLDDATFGFSGAYSHSSGKLPLLKIGVSADKIDLDALAAQGKKTEEELDYTTALKALDLPFDLDFDLGAQALRTGGQDVKGARVQGLVKDGSIRLTNASVQDYAGARASLKGSIGNINKLSGIDLSFSGETQNIRQLAEVMKWDVSSLPASLKAAKLGAKISGDVSNLAVSANVDALDGQFIAKGKVQDPLGALAIDGLAVQVKHKNMASAMKIFAPNAPAYSSLAKPMDFYADIKREGEITTLSNIKGDLAGGSLEGRVSLDSGADIPVLTGDLKFGDLALVSAKKKATPKKRRSSSAEAKPKLHSWSSERANLDWMRGFNAELEITANSIMYEAWDLKNPALSLALKDGSLEIEKLEAGLFDGQVSMVATVNAPVSAQKPASFNATPRFENVSLEPLVKALAGNAIIKGKGLVSMNADLSSTGLSQQALVGSMRGSGTLTGQDMVLEGFDLTRFARALSDETKPGDTLLGLWKGTTKGGSTAFDTMDGAFEMAEGVANITKLDMDGPKAFLSTSGNVNLPKWWVNTAHTITLKERKDVPPFTINIDGSLDNPGQTFAQGAMEDYFSRKINRKLEKLLTDKLGLPSGRQQEPEQQVEPSGEEQEPAQEEPQQQQITPEEAFRGLLEGLIQ